MAPSKAWLMLLLLAVSPSAAGRPVPHGDGPARPLPLGRHRAAALRHGRLAAWDTRTGRLLWAFGRGLGDGPYRDGDGAWQPEEGIVFAAHGRVFTYSHQGRLYAVSAQSGRLLWSAATGVAPDVTRNRYGVWKNFGLVAMDGDADTLAVAHFHGLTVYDAATGREEWRITLPPEDTGSTDVNLTPRVLLLERFTEGAGMHTETDAYDRRTGTLLWMMNGSFDPDKPRGGVIEVDYFNLGEFLDHPHWLHHQVIEERTGKVLREYLTK